MTEPTTEALLLQGVRAAFATSGGNVQTPERIVAFLRGGYLPAIEQAAAAPHLARIAALVDAVTTFLREQRVDAETNRCQCEDAYLWDGIHRPPCLWEATQSLRVALTGAAAPLTDERDAARVAALEGASNALLDAMSALEHQPGAGSIAAGSWYTERHRLEGDVREAVNNLRAALAGADTAEARIAALEKALKAIRDHECDVPIDEWSEAAGYGVVQDIARAALSGPAASEGAREPLFHGQMTWPCVCGHPKSDHYFGDTLGPDRRMHTWCQRCRQGIDTGCLDFRPAPVPSEETP